MLKKLRFRSLSKKQGKDTTVMPDVRVLVHYSGSNSPSHFALWQQTLSNSGIGYLSVFRNYRSMDIVNNCETAIAARSMSDVSKLLARLPNLQMILYPGNTIHDMVLVKLADCEHIFIGHGDSNKSASAHKGLRIYDEIWTAGEAHIDRFKSTEGNYSSLVFRKIGQPWMKNLIDLPPRGSQATTVNWAYFPTWRGPSEQANYSSLPSCIAIREAVSGCLPDGSIGYAKPHNLTTKQEIRDLEKAQFTHLLKHEVSLSETLERGLDFVICDVSAAVTECLYARIPIFLYVDPDREPTVLGDYSFAYVFRNIKELVELVHRVIIEQDDFLKHKRETAFSYRVDVKATKNDGFTNELVRKIPTSPM